jgi:hypothetical protein
VDWAGFFDRPGRPPAKHAKKIDGLLCSAIMRLPQALTGDVEVEAFHGLGARISSAATPLASRPARPSRE